MAANKANVDVETSYEVDHWDWLIYSTLFWLNGTLLETGTYCFISIREELPPSLRQSYIQNNIIIVNFQRDHAPKIVFSVSGSPNN